MNADQDLWRIWVHTLQRWGVQEWAASFLEAAGPLTILGAQVIYLSQPFFGRTIREGHLEALARLLEDTDQTQAFTAYLREGSSQ